MLFKCIFTALAAALCVAARPGLVGRDVVVVTTTRTTTICTLTNSVYAPTSTLAAVATYLPAIHWDQNLTDINNLAPGEVDLLYYTVDGTAGKSQPDQVTKYLI
jgi:hypothetical protein